MPVVHTSTTFLNGLAEATKTEIDSGGAGAILSLYTGTMPANTSTAITDQVLLGNLTASYPCGSVALGELTFSSISIAPTALDDGTVTWCRVKKSDNTVVMDVDVTGLVGTGAIKMNSTTITAGIPILINSFVISFTG